MRSSNTVAAGNSAVFVLGIVGAALGIAGSMLWIAFGFRFWYDAWISLFASRMIFTHYDHGNHLLMTVVTLSIHVALSMTCFMLALVQVCRIKWDNPREAGTRLIALGVISIVVNFLSILPAAVLIVVGALVLSGGRKQKIEQQT